MSCRKAVRGVAWLASVVVSAWWSAKLGHPLPIIISAGMYAIGYADGVDSDGGAWS